MVFSLLVWYNIHMTESKIVENIIISGHKIADKIKNASSVSDIDNLSEEIQSFCDNLDENFGDLGDIGEKENKLSAILYMAAEEKARQLEYYPDQNDAGNEDIIEFEEILDSKNWTKNSAE